MTAIYRTISDAVYNHLTGKISKKTLEGIVLQQKIFLSERVFCQLRDADTTFEHLLSLFEKKDSISVALDHTKLPLSQTRCSLDSKKFSRDERRLKQREFSYSTSYHFHPNGQRSQVEDTIVNFKGLNTEYYDYYPSSVDVRAMIKSELPGLIGCSSPDFNIRAWIPIYLYEEDVNRTNQYCIIPFLKYFSEMKADLIECLDKFIVTVFYRHKDYHADFAFFELPIRNLKI